MGDATAPSPRRALRTGTYVGYAWGSVGTGIFSAVPGLLLLTFMVRHLEIPPALAGTVILIPRLWDVVTDPLAGSLSDRTRTRIGARRPWLFAGALLLPLTFALLFRVPELSGRAAAWYVLGVYIAGTTAFTIFQVPYVSMPAEMTPHYHERTTILAWRIAFLTLGILVAGAAAPEIVSAGGGGRDGFASMGLVIGAVLLAALLSCAIGTRGVPVAEPVPVTAPFRDQLRAAAANQPFFVLLGTFVLQALGVGAMLAGVDFFAAYVLEDAGQTTFLFAFLVGPALITMPLWAWVGRRSGKRFGYVACTVIFAVGALSLVTADPSRLWLVYLQVFVMGTAYAGTQMFPFAMLPDTVSADTARTGLRRSGAYSGVWTAGEKAGMAVGPAAFAAILAVTGFIETEGGAIVDQPPAAITGLTIGFAVLPAVLMLLSLLLLRRYHLDEADVAGFEHLTGAATGIEPTNIPPISAPPTGTPRNSAPPTDARAADGRPAEPDDDPGPI